MRRAGQGARALGTVLLAAFVLAAIAGAATITQKDGVRVAVDGKLSPQALPRKGDAPVSVSIGGRISTPKGELPPQLKRLVIEINRHGRLDTRGLPVCPKQRIQPATTAKALASCRTALVGSGLFSAAVMLKGQEPYPSKGRLLVFNGREHGRPVLYGQIYTPQPFANSFVITFEIKPIARGDYGTALIASLPDSLGSWGYVTGISMTLSRRYSYRGERRSFLSAGCPVPKGLSRASFSLARTSFTFSGGTKLSPVLDRSCRARG